MIFILKLFIASGAVYFGKNLYKKNQKKMKTPDDSKSFSPLKKSDNDDLLKKEKKVSRALVVSSTSLGIATLGRIFYSPLAILSVPATIYTVVPIFGKGYRALREGKFTVHILASMGITICLYQQYFWSCSLSCLFYAIRNKLLLMVKNDFHENLIDVFQQYPHTVWVLHEGIEIETSFEELTKGDIVVVNSGETIPVDGVIIEGTASIDQHILTGEAYLIEKGVDELVFALTVVLMGKIYISAEKTGEETTVAEIGRILNCTSNFKTKLQLRAERVADRAVLPTMAAAGIALPIVGPSGVAAIISAHFGYKLSVIVNMGIMNYLHLMSRNGILIKDGRTLELFGKIDTLIFDKTGTLTSQQPHIGGIYSCSQYTEDEILVYAAAAESKQNHPVALAIIEAAKIRQLTIPTIDIDMAEYKIGYGLKVKINKDVIHVGSQRFMLEEDISIPMSILKIQKNNNEEGHTSIMIALDGHLIGLIELLATVRPEAKMVIQTLCKNYGIQSTYIISGDHKIPTKKLAELLEINHYFSEVLPQDKAKIIDDLQKSGRNVCYIGDGINDAIALKKAAISVSIQGASAVAIDAADVILMNESLKQLIPLFDLASEFEKIAENCFKIIATPTIIGIAGAFFGGIGVPQVIILKQMGTMLGIGTVMLPMIKHNQRK